MDKVSKRKRKFQVAAYVLAALFIIIGEVFGTAIAHNGATEVGRLLFWFFITIAFFAFAPEMTGKKVDVAIRVAIILVVAIIFGCFSIKSAYSAAGVLAAVIPGYFLARGLKKRKNK
jgi:uncharacterized membrane protein